MKKVLSLVLALALVLGCVSLAAAEDAKIKLVVWSFTNELEGMIRDYYMPNHPEVEFDFHMVPTADFPGAVDTQLAADAVSDNAPDVFALEAAFVKKYVNSADTANLKDLGFTDEELAGAIPVMAQIGSDAEGNNIENGVPVDVELVVVDADGKKDYSAFYDIGRLSEVMHGLYSE